MGDTVRRAYGVSSVQDLAGETGTGRDRRRCGAGRGRGSEGGSGSGGDNAAEIVAVTRSDARASLTYSREAVIDNDADLLAAAAGERGVDGNPAHEQLNDLPSLGVREVRLQALTDLREHILRDGIVKRVISRF